MSEFSIKYIWDIFYVTQKVLKFLSYQIIKCIFLNLISPFLKTHLKEVKGKEEKWLISQQFYKHINLWKKLNNKIKPHQSLPIPFLIYTRMEIFFINI